MDPNRFDDLSRELATRSTRRRSIRQIGLLGGLSALAGLRPSTGIARATSECSFSFHAEGATGPTKKTRYDGEISIVIDETGAVDDGRFGSSDGESYKVSGQAIGSSLQLRIRLDADRFLLLTGVGANDLSLCRGRIDGAFSGPMPRDLGTWSTDLGKSDSSDESATTVPAATGGGEPAACALECPAGWVLDLGSCSCFCPGALEPCGETCCYAGSICDPEQSTCACPGGTNVCNDVCHPTCDRPGKGELQDPNTCECVVGPIMVCSAVNVTSDDGISAVIDFGAGNPDVSNAYGYDCDPPSGSTFLVGATEVICTGYGKLENSTCKILVTVTA